MELSSMVAQLKEEEFSIAKTLKERNEEANAVRFRLGVLEAEINKLNDKHAAIKMAVESLELVKDDSNPVITEEPAERPVPEFIRLKQEAEKAKDTVPAEKSHSRKPRKIGKYDPNGKKIGEYPSITQAAKAFGWGNVPMAKYVENESKEKQIKLRGFYLKFIAA